jgi:amphi-Trp domain-containing protein
MSSNNRFEFETIQDPAALRDQLASILDGLAKGRLTLATEDQEIVLVPGPLLKVSVKAKRKDDESRLSVKITWKDVRADEAVAGKSITIGS